MSFMGIFSAKEVENIKKLAYEEGARHTKVECNKEKNKLTNEFEVKIDKLNRQNKDLMNDIVEVNSEVVELDTKITILEFFLLCEYDKKIKRLEAIAKRTKKHRVKKKCENRILTYEMRKLAFEH